MKVVLCLLLAGVGHDTEEGWCSKADSCNNLIFLNALSVNKINNNFKYILDPLLLE